MKINVTCICSQKMQLKSPRNMRKEVLNNSTLTGQIESKPGRWEQRVSYLAILCNLMVELGTGMYRSRHPLASENRDHHPLSVFLLSPIVAAAEMSFTRTFTWMILVDKGKAHTFGPKRPPRGWNGIEISFRILGLSRYALLISARLALHYCIGLAFQIM